METKLCKDCEHQYKSRCYRPHQLTGLPLFPAPTCQEERRLYLDGCGPDGQFYEPVDIEKREAEKRALLEAQDFENLKRQAMSMMNVAPTTWGGKE